MSLTIREKARDLPVRDRYDVIVCGGGVAGISAALAAARQGARVALLEREYALGGLATLGLIAIYLPLCNGRGVQCSYGIAEELLRLSIEDGADGRRPDCWLDGDPGEEAEEQRKNRRFEVQYNPSYFAIRAEQLLRECGVEILYGLSVTGGRKSGKKLTHILCEGREGRFALACGSAVDATGDATLCRLLGMTCATYAYRNTLPSWYYYLGGDGRVKLQLLGYAENPNIALSESEGNPAVDPTKPHFVGLDTFEVSRMTCAAHDQLLSHYLERGGITPNHQLTSIATLPQLRMTARLCGRYTLDVGEADTEMPDSIGMIGDWRKAGPLYEIPFGCLWSEETVNLSVAGRMISVTDKMWDISRVIPACAVTGQAAGTAAALSRNFETLSLPRLQKALARDGVILHKKELHP